MSDSKLSRSTPETNKALLAEVKQLRLKARAIAFKYLLKSIG